MRAETEVDDIKKDHEENDIDRRRNERENITFYIRNWKKSLWKSSDWSCYRLRSCHGHYCPGELINWDWGGRLNVWASMPYHDLKRRSLPGSVNHRRFFGDPLRLK